MIDIVRAVKDSCHQLLIFASNLCVICSDLERYETYYIQTSLSRQLTHSCQTSKAQA